MVPGEWMTPLYAVGTSRYTIWLSSAEEFIRDDVGRNGERVRLSVFKCLGGEGNRGLVNLHPQKRINADTLQVRNRKPM